MIERKLAAVLGTRSHDPSLGAKVKVHDLVAYARERRIANAGQRRANALTTRKSSRITHKSLYKVRLPSTQLGVQPIDRHWLIVTRDGLRSVVFSIAR
jgi:hypothetical protein